MILEITGSSAAPTGWDMNDGNGFALYHVDAAGEDAPSSSGRHRDAQEHGGCGQVNDLLGATAQHSVACRP